MGELNDVVGEDETSHGQGDNKRQWDEFNQVPLQEIIFLVVSKGQEAGWLRGRETFREGGYRWVQFSKQEDIIFQELEPLNIFFGLVYNVLPSWHFLSGYLLLEGFKIMLDGFEVDEVEFRNKLDMSR